MTSPLETLPSPELLVRTRSLVGRGNAVEAELLRHLGEVDARRIHLEEGFPSMFGFCVRVLHFAEAVAYKRIQAARAARLHPELLEAVRTGDLHLTAVGLLAPQLTRENCAELIRAARHRKADDIRRLLADRQPKPDVPTSMVRVPAPEAPASAAPVRSEPLVASVPPPQRDDAPVRREAPQEALERVARSEPLGGERYCVRFTAGPDLHAQLEELRALMRHQIPDGDVGKIIARAIPLLLEQVRKRKFGECTAPRAVAPPSETPSRSIPAAVRRAVSQRDEGRCRDVSPSGRRCEAREFLEFDHLEPWAFIHRHPVDGIALRCRAHNQQAARRAFGERHMVRFGNQSNATKVGGSAAGPRPRSDPSPQQDLDPVPRE